MDKKLALVFLSALISLLNLLFLQGTLLYMTAAGCAVLLAFAGVLLILNPSELSSGQQITAVGFLIGSMAFLFNGLFSGHPFYFATAALLPWAAQLPQLLELFNRTA